LNFVNSVLLASVFIFILEACVSNNPHGEIKRIVVFGDSNVDSRNLYRLTNHQIPASPHWQGRTSNGPLVTEYLAQSLEVKLENYAVAGATTGETNIVATLIPVLKQIRATGMRAQIAQFIQRGHQLSHADLIVLWAGSNDIFRIRRDDKADLRQSIERATNNLEAAISRLYDLGGRNVIVATRTPRTRLETDDNLNGRDLNQAIEQLIARYPARTGLTIDVFDAYASISDMMRNPRHYGFSENVHDLCIENSVCVAEQFEDGLQVADGYINWDAAHKTTRVHRLMANQLNRMLAHK